MVGVSDILFLLVPLLLSLHCSSYPLCINSRAPTKLETPLKFCSYNGSACCDSADDLELQNLFQSTNITDPECASFLKSILCAKCDQYSAQLFNNGTGDKSVPVLCNSTYSTKSHEQDPESSADICSKIYYTCGNTPISNSPFASAPQGTGKLISPATTKLASQWKSRSSFCRAFGGISEEGGMCFNGETASFTNGEEAEETPKGLCLERMSIGGYIAMEPHPDGSNRVFLAKQEGKIWIATVPKEGSQKILELDESNPFLDITEQVIFSTGFGLMGMAFHPNFTTNGRFFVSFNCDKLQQSGCFGRCSCNTDVNCDPSKIGLDNGVQPCQYHNVVAEFTVNGTASEPSMAERANPAEVRRIFTMGLTYRKGHAGQILFGPEDGYLYIPVADNSRGDEPYHFAQSKKSLLGKILRVDIDNIPSAAEVHERSRWGNYSIPRDNPYVDDKELEPEIWASGFRNPWRCSFDSERPSYFLCGDSGQDQYEEVDIVTKGGNYGWNLYEGPFRLNISHPPAMNLTATPTNPIFPVMGYNHSETDKTTGSASIIGGYFYRSNTDPCMYGRYLYTDLYVGGTWAGTETPKGSGNFTPSKLSLKCANDSPMQCNKTVGRNTPALGYIFSSAEDNRKDFYILASTGVYRVSRPSRCKYRCSKESVFVSQRPVPSTCKSEKLWTDSQALVYLCFFLVLGL